MNCKTCAWWENGYDGQEGPKASTRGYCHRYPPIVITWNVDGSDTCWPETSAEDFCGEFKA